MEQNSSPFGHQLRHWRKLRGMSQLDLATRAAVSPRHVSFCETGRSRPGETMVLKLAEVLDVPLRDRNDLLRSAGFGAVYPERSITDEALGPLRQVLQEMLRSHEPYPAYVINRLWFMVDANQAARRLMPHVNLDQGPIDAIELFFDDRGRALIANFDEVAGVALARMRREAMADPSLLPRLAELERRVGQVSPPGRERIGDSPAVCTRLRIGDREIETISVIARFGTAQDVTLDELRVELVFPADEAAVRFFAELA